jgi:hypothetical protein
MHEASIALGIDLYFVLNPNSGGMVGDSPGGNLAFRVGPFDLKNATMRDILNQIVSQHIKGNWVVQQPPWMMGKGLWVPASGRCWSTTGQMLTIAGNSRSGAWVCKQPSLCRTASVSPPSKSQVAKNPYSTQYQKAPTFAVSCESLKDHT